MALLMANPIYDCVFNYLLTDAEIAKELLAAILGEEIVSLEALPREKYEQKTSEHRISRLRFHGTHALQRVLASRTFL